MRHSILHRQSKLRVFGIPGPVNFYKIAQEIVLNWPYLYRHCASSPFSLSYPVPDERGVRCIRERFLPEQAAASLQKLNEGYDFMLKTDIAAYYESVYLPTISLAICEGISEAAEKKLMLPICDNISRLIQNAQNGRLTGMPVGPDSSFLMAEVFLSGIDAMIYREGLHTGLRYSDEYKIGFCTEAEAERAMTLISSIMSEFRLELNSRKTRIVRSDHHEDSMVALELLAMMMENTNRVRSSELEYYFEKAFEIAASDPSLDTLRYAVMRLLTVKIPRSCWPQFLRSLFQCAVLDPGILGEVCHFVILNESDEFIKLHESDEYPIDLDSLLSTIISIIDTYAPLGYENEVAWAIWILMQFGLSLGKETAKKLIPMTNSIVTLLALDAQQRGCIDPNLDIGTWIYDTEEDVIFGEHWLLAYEGWHQGWLSSSHLEKQISDHPAFRFLKDEGVSFYFHENSG
jgi:hypothetical protein